MDVSEILVDLKLLESNSIPVAPYVYVEKSKEAMDAADKLGYPVVLKIASNIHKTEVGGVVTNIHNPLDLADAWQKITKSIQEKGVQTNGFILQKQIKGVELIVGLKQDPSFGPLLMVGSGGIFTEILKDVSFRLCPVSEKDVEQMLSEIKASKLFSGVRGNKAVNLEVLKKVILEISRLHSKIKIKEMDINPLIANEQGCWVVDVRIFN